MEIGSKDLNIILRLEFLNEFLKYWFKLTILKGLIGIICAFDFQQKKKKNRSTLVEAPTEVFLLKTLFQ